MELRNKSVCYYLCIFYSFIIPTVAMLLRAGLTEREPSVPKVNFLPSAAVGKDSLPTEFSFNPFF